MPVDPDDMGLGQASMNRIAALMASSDASDARRFDPPADLWRRIETGMTGPVVLSAVDELPTPITSAGSARTAPTAQPKRWRVLAIAAAVVMVAAVAGVLVTRTSERPISTTRLVALEGTASLDAVSVDAELIKVDGQLKLRLTAHNMDPAPDGNFYELWLMDRTNTVPHSLGPMTGTSTVTVPATVDVDQFPVVDISVQPEGKPAYSGHSILRGTLS